MSAAEQPVALLQLAAFTTSPRSMDEPSGRVRDPDATPSRKAEATAPFSTAVKLGALRNSATVRSKAASAA